MLAPWAVEEMKTADLKDKRLNDRLAIVLSQLGAHPTASIPAACGGLRRDDGGLPLLRQRKGRLRRTSSGRISIARTRGSRPNRSSCWCRTRPRST